jgi:hypothetical protein
LYIAETHLCSVDGTPVGALFLKYLISKTVIDTKVTAAQVREDLGDLPAYMLSVDSDIRVFNQHVRIIRQGLTCRGESIDDLMVHLFRGYL